MLITTTKHVTPKIELKAQYLSVQLGGHFIGRDNLGLLSLMRKFHAAGIMVVLEDRLKFVSLDGSELFFHPNLAKIRVTSLLCGSADRLLKIAGAKRGDSVLDCTMGLGTDAIVLSFAVGVSGKVVTLESELVPFALAQDGLSNYQSGVRKLDDAMRRIEAIRANHLDYLQKLPDKSIDIVYFDPMFREPDNTVALTPLRHLANHAPIQPESIYEAKRVGRRKIILKEHRTSGEFERLGFQLVPSKSSSTIDYGEIQLEGNAE